MNWLPPRSVQQSTHATMHGGVSPGAIPSSASSGKGFRNGIRLRHIVRCPVSPWIWYTDGYRRSGSSSYPGGTYTHRGRTCGSPSTLPLSASLSNWCSSNRPWICADHGSIAVSSRSGNPMLPAAAELLPPARDVPVAAGVGIVIRGHPAGPLPPPDPALAPGAPPGAASGAGGSRSRAARCRRGTSVLQDEPGGRLAERGAGPHVIPRTAADPEGMV